jgi:hypothetical protein
VSSLTVTREKFSGVNVKNFLSTAVAHHDHTTAGTLASSLSSRGA